MNTQEFTEKVGGIEVTGKIEEYTKADGSVVGYYNVVLFPDIRKMYRDSVDVLVKPIAFPSRHKIANDVFDLVRQKMIIGFQSNCEKEHIVVTRGKHGVTFAALVTSRSDGQTKTAKSESAKARHYLRSICPVGNLRQFRLDRCGKLIVDGVDLLL